MDTYKRCKPFEVGLFTNLLEFTTKQNSVIGRMFSTRTSGIAEIIEIVDKRRVKIRFLNTGNIKETWKNNLRTGRVKDSEFYTSNFKYRNGTIHPTNNFGDIEVVDYKLSDSVLIRFLNTGNNYTTSTSCIAEGKISDTIYQETIKNYRKGLTLNTKHFGKFTIIENLGTEKARIKFVESGNEQVVTVNEIINLTVKDHVVRDDIQGDRRFCVYLHKDSAGIVRYVGEGTIARANSRTRKDQPHWELLFRNNPPQVEIVLNNLTKTESEQMELHYREIYSDTIINNKYAKKTPHRISRDFVSSFVYYDETSPTCLRWLNRMKNNALQDSPAGSSAGVRGYSSVEICGTNYLCHRVVWTLIHGDFDSGCLVDHINGSRSDNRIANLRLVTHHENARNKLCAIPSSGYRLIREGPDGLSYGIRWSDGGHRKYKNFSIKYYGTKEKCLFAAYKFREALIESGELSPRIRQGEVSLLQTERFEIETKRR